MAYIGRPCINHEDQHLSSGSNERVQGVVHCSPNAILGWLVIPETTPMCHIPTIAIVTFENIIGQKARENLMLSSYRDLASVTGPSIPKRTQ